MRDFLDAILDVIESESLTDEEFESIEVEAQVYDQDTYDALKEVLEARESVSEKLERLEQYFLARGAELDSDSSESEPASQIFIGDDISE